MPRLHATLVFLLAVGCSTQPARILDGTGGTPGTGGIPATGGVPGSGGLLATGGIPGTGGLLATGGAPDGGAGTPGVAGTGGSGRGGSGGVGGGPPMCASAKGGSADGGVGGTGGTPVDVESCIYDATKSLVETAVSAPVTVVSVDQVSAGNCGGFSFIFSTTPVGVSSKVVFETADHQQQWTVYLRIPNLPADTVRVGDSFDLSVSAQSVFWQGLEQMMTLSRSGQLVLFGYSGYEAVSPGAPGITIKNAGVTCSEGPCGFIHHAVNVATGADSAVVREGETRQVGNLSFTLSHDVEWQSGSGPNGACDASNHVIMGGFIVSP